MAHPPSSGTGRRHPPSSSNQGERVAPAASEQPAILFATVALIRTRSIEDRVCLNTFSELRMWKTRRAAAGLDLAYSTPITATLWLKAASYIPFLPYRTSADVSQAPVKDRGIPVLDERFVRRAHRAGLPVIVWTINDSTEMDRLLDVGVDGILSDRPTTLKSVLQERGQWIDP